ncbi:sucrase-6-phosphate hydrolase (gene sacA) [Pontibacillus halophilus JSM 076056 = DSM 19796]|uniref:Sucrose-6-phosphate hydrolase n=1 Tax=Pontibacillus halophilus JSM 076056 = DSM 19796 TaxID=1385510 RepID=A0A0A5GKI4_9BACI|nr:sucrose-6-phosphate hydrolase [Pontibacillus halophilus]KGX93796.1 sucrase-6-phosphate hydrolase (gene sacA) [Pontibacillus halophilus JSM 076056 = DSM 19796]
MSERDEQLRQEAYEQVEKHKTMVEADPYRLKYHIMPPVGLLNDPNGFIQFNGTYHMFYQWMPFKTGHGAKFWGHYTSEDLVTWTEQPIALTPSEWYEKDGCYSGSAIEHDGKLYLFYTGNVKDEDGNRESYQCMAISEDGIHFEKKGPVLELPEEYTAHFRDPKVWKEAGRFYMVIGTQNHDEQGRAVLFVSDDLHAWEHVGVVTGSHTDQLDEFGFMWECPDIFHLNGQDVLAVSPQGLEAKGMHYNNVYQSGYFVGSLNYETGHLQHGEFQELDRGFEFYAPQTTVDDQGRRILVGWMGVPDQYEEEQPTIKHKWVHTLTMPRELSLENGKVIQKPIKELETKRGAQMKYEDADIKNEVKQFGGINGLSVELQIDIKKNLSKSFDIEIRNNMRLIYNRKEGLLTLERKSFVNGRTESRHCYVEDLKQLRLFLDTSSLEVFVNGGEEVFTSRMFPDAENTTILFAANGSVTADISRWHLHV